jgi:hypothetical protein
MSARFMAGNDSGAARRGKGLSRQRPIAAKANRGKGLSRRRLAPYVALEARTSGERR